MLSNRNLIKWILPLEESNWSFRIMIYSSENGALNKPVGDIIYGSLYSVSKQYTSERQKIFRIWYFPEDLLTISTFIYSTSLSRTTFFSSFLLSYNSFIKFLFFNEIEFLANPLRSAPFIGFIQRKNCWMENPRKSWSLRSWASSICLS